MNDILNEGVISVIVPVHNGEETIKRCINSILKQKYENIEIIVVDDNSTDSTNDIVKELSEKSANITCIKLTEGSKGVSYARNIGLDIAKGEYIGFVDADDFISENMYDMMLSKLRTLNSDVIICAYSFLYEDGKTVNPTEYLTDAYKASFSTEEALLELMKMDHARFTGHVWDKLYKKEIIGDIKFAEGIHCFEDTLFNVEVMIKANRIDFFNTSLYWYYVNEASVTNSRYNDKIYSSIQALERIEKLDLIKQNEALMTAVQNRIFKECIAQSYASAASPKCEEYIAQFRKILMDRIKNLHTLDLTLKEKMQIFLLVHTKIVYKYMVKRKNN